MIQSQEKLTTNTWRKADWETYVNTIDAPEHEQHRGYYYNGCMRIEDMPTGAKRLLYEEMDISEYWIVDVQNTLIYAFEMVDRGSRRIDTSVVLPELSIDTITTALNLSKEQNQTQIGQWLMKEFQT